MRPVIDGERKALLRRVDASTFLFVGLLRRSEWATVKAEPGVMLTTQRALMGATLHVESLKGQMPVAGQTRIPAALFAHRSGRARTGRQMDNHLTAIAAQRSAERQYARILQGAKKVIL